MLPDPLHPAVVHLPIALAFIVPLLAAGVWLAIRGGVLPERTWALVAALQILFAGSAWVAIETGENEEERAERVVAEERIEEHEEAAERLAIAASVVAVVIAAGLLPDRIGRAARALGTLASFAVVAAAVAAGHSGGELVYRHGAASAYAKPGAPAEETP
jgi:uncharacterized membrane protein